MNITYEWAAIGALGSLCLLLTFLVYKLGQRVRQISQSQKALIQQSDAVHRAQVAYAEATEEALCHLRDGMQSLTTVSANLDMKSYALELQQARMGQRMKTHEMLRQKTTTAARPVQPTHSAAVANAPEAARSPGLDASATSVKKSSGVSRMSSERPLSQAERDLMAAIAPKQAQCA